MSSFLLQCPLNQRASFPSPSHFSRLCKRRQSPSLEQLLSERYRLDVVFIEDVVLQCAEVFTFEEHLGDFVLNCERVPHCDNALGNVRVVRSPPIVQQHFPILANSADLPEGLLQPRLVKYLD